MEFKRETITIWAACPIRDSPFCQTFDVTKRTMRFLCLVCLFLVTLSPVRVFSAEGLPRDSWPASWFQAPQAASERGITSFTESPILTRQVKHGRLPPLRQRLPADPYVVEPLEGLGRHGGMLRVFSQDAGLVIGLENPLGMDPEVHTVLPNLASGYNPRQ